MLRLKMKKWIAVLLAIVIFFSVLFIGMGIFETTKPKPKNTEFYKNGTYVVYKLQWRVITPEGKRSGFGTLILTVNNNILTINVTVPNLYSDGNSLYRDIKILVKNESTYYRGEKIILPFFYMGGKKISYYNKSYVNVTGRISSLVNFQGGIIEFQPIYYLYNEDFIRNPNGTLKEKGLSGTYEYGTNTNLLFFYYCGIAYDPIMYVLLNLTYPEKLPNGEIWNMPLDIGLSLHKTNIDLGPVDYFAVIIGLIWIGLPLILLILIPAIIIGAYKTLKNKKE